ncbi:MAG: hypothetical protein MOB07_07415 [Acidobacteria bacterium]|nr:hypothetical protein [Acidobacteriota bacterium]
MRSDPFGHLNDASGVAVERRGPKRADAAIAMFVAKMEVSKSMKNTQGARHPK